MKSDPGEITDFWPESAEVQAGGTVVIRITGRERARGRWGGFQRVAPESADYGFWRWVVENKEHWPTSFSEADLPAIRAEFERQVG
jgi:hypothetical protein